MKREKELKTKWLHVRLSEREYTILQNYFQGTSERKISAYIRKIILGKPMIGVSRDASLDALVTELSALLKTLNGVSNNFNQAVHKLHMLGRIEEFRAWYSKWDKEKKVLIENIDQIKIFIQKVGEKWLQ